MKKNISLAALLSCLGALTFFDTSAFSSPDPCPVPGNFTETFKEDFQSGTVSNTGTYRLYASASNHKDVPNTPILVTGQQHEWRVGPRFYGVNRTDFAYTGDYEKQGYNPNNVNVLPGIGLQILIKHESTIYNLAADGEGATNPDWQGDGTFHFSSGYLNSDQEFAQRYGYFEARIKLPYGPGAGFWGGFYLLPDRGISSSSDTYEYTTDYNGASDLANEIDICEFISNWQNASAPYAAFCSSTIQTVSSTAFTDNNPPSLINPEGTFHNYGMYWGPGIVHFYIDGVDVADVSSSKVSSAPSYMNLEQAVTDKDWGTNTPITEAQTAAFCPPTSPASMTVAHVYVWQGRIAPPTSDLLLNATMTASSSDLGQTAHGPTYDPFAIDLVVDGFPSSDGFSNGWRSGTGVQNRTEWLQADMGASYPINTITLCPRTDQPGANFPTDFTISTSTDGTTFTPVITKAGYANPGSTPKTFTFPNTTARYVKVTGTAHSIDPSDSTYRMAFAEITGFLDPTVHLGGTMLGTVATIDPFTSPSAVTYNYYNAYHAGGYPSASDFGSVASGVWSPNVSGSNTDHFVVNNAAFQLMNVGDSVSLAIKNLTAGDNPALGLLLSAGLTPSGSVAQTELLLQRYPSGYEVANYTSPNGDTAAQTDYSTMTVTETAYDTSSNMRTFSVKVSGGGITPISTTAYLVGTNCYVGLGAFGNWNGMQGATAKNFLITRSSATPDLALGASLAVTSSNESLPSWGQSLLLDGLLNGSALGYGWQSSSSTATDHVEQCTVDFGTVIPVSNITLWPRTDHPGQNFPINFAVKTSPDGMTWSTAEYITNYGLPGSAGQSINFPSTVSTRYLNVYGLNLRADPQDSGKFRMGFAEVTASGPTTDLALSKTVTASSTYTTSPWGLAKLVDGQNYSGGSSNGWLSNNTLTASHTEWVQVDLGSSQTFTTVTLYPRTDQLGQSFPLNFNIQTSATGAAGSWSTPVTCTAFPAPTCTGTTFGEAFTVPTTTARYIKVTGTTLSKNPSDNTYRMGFAEITVN